MKNSARRSHRTRTTWPTENRNQRKYKEQTKGDFDEHKSEPGQCQTHTSVILWAFE